MRILAPALLCPMLCSLLPLTAQERLLQPADLPARAAAAARLADGVAAPATPEGSAMLRAAVQAAHESLPAGSAAHARAARLATADLDRDTLRRETTALLRDLQFTPIMEAELPEGVPGYVALDEIELREYPAYRMARTTMRGSTAPAFWSLFLHIQRREIAMTAPVQMEQPSTSGDVGSMAFLYGSPELGPLGRDGRVEVVDQPATTVLSIGARGYDTAQRTTALRARLDAWLASHPEYEAAGAFRIMGYNSPSVSAERRYFEVQLPVRRRALPATSPERRPSV